MRAPLAEIEAMRKISNRYGFMAILCFILFGWSTYRTIQYISKYEIIWSSVFGVGTLFSLILVLGYSSLCRKNFLLAWALFYRRNYVPALHQLEADGYDWENISDPNALRKLPFWRVKDLREFEVSLFDYLRSFRRTQDLLTKNRKWEAANFRLTEQLKIVLSEFQLSEEEQTATLARFRLIQNPRRRSEFISSITQKLAHERWLKGNSHRLTVTSPGNGESIQVSVEDIKLRSLEVQASKVVSPKALVFYDQGMAAENRREKIRLFKQALSVDVREAESQIETTGAIQSHSKESAEPTLAEVKYTTLQDFARERLEVMQSLVSGADWKMCREIVLVLAEPGRSGGRFTNHYYAEDTVKKMVRRQCNIYADETFDPHLFKEAVNWLLRYGVVKTKRKTDERTLSMSAHVKGAKTPEAGQIISSVILTKREMKGLPV